MTPGCLVSRNIFLKDIALALVTIMKVEEEKEASRQR